MGGTLFPFQFYGSGQKGGILLYPVSGIVAGCEITDVDISSSDDNVAVLTINKGEFKLDGNRHSQPLTSINIALASNVDLNSDDVKFDVYVNPKRKVPVVQVGSPAPTVVEDAQYISAHFFPNYYVVDTIYIGKSGVWKPVDPMKDLGPGGYGFVNLPFNDIDNSLVTASQFSYKPEYPIFIKNTLPPHLSSQGKAMLRQTCSIKLATIEFSGGSGTIVEGLLDVDRLVT